MCALQCFGWPEASGDGVCRANGKTLATGELLRRLGDGRSAGGACLFLIEWERWAAELLESHLSFPVLSCYRSQHDNQSWVGALTTIFDTT
jgi:hypothetical protein